MIEANRVRERDAELRPLITFTSAGFKELRGTLLQAEEETAAFILATPTLTPAGNWRLIVREILYVGSEEYVRRTSAAIELPPAVLARVMQQARSNNLSVIVAHSHPGSDAKPSLQDYQGESLVVPALRRRIPHVPHGRLIVSQTGISAALFDPGAEGDPIAEKAADLVLTGRDITWLSGSSSETIDFSSSGSSEQDYSEHERFDRQVRAFGAAGQRALAALRVAIVGLGGTGSIVAQQLAHLGVQNFLLIDHDTVEKTNLNRLAGATEHDVGRPKVDVASRFLRTISPNARIQATQADVSLTDVARLLLDTDCFFSCTDSHGSRWVLTRLAYQHLVPGFDLGVAIRAHEGQVTHIAGRVQMLAPGLACLACGTDLDPEQVRRDLLTEAQRAADPYVVGAQANATMQPAVMSINGVAASLAVTMFLSAVTGIPNTARYQRLRLESGTVARVDAVPREDCIVCSPTGFFATGDAGGELGRPTP